MSHIVEIGGPSTLAQSLKAIKIEGVISIIGFLGGAGAVGGKGAPSFLDVLGNVCTVRGILAGSRQQMEDMNQAIEANKVKPFVDEKIWDFRDVKEAMTHMVRIFFCFFGGGGGPRQGASFQHANEWAHYSGIRNTSVRL